jgi:hypothetical protein
MSALWNEVVSFLRSPVRSESKPQQNNSENDGITNDLMNSEQLSSSISEPMIQNKEHTIEASTVARRISIFDSNMYPSLGNTSSRRSSSIKQQYHHCVGKEDDADNREIGAAAADKEKDENDVVAVISTDSAEPQYCPQKSVVIVEHPQPQMQQTHPSHHSVLKSSTKSKNPLRILPIKKRLSTNRFKNNNSKRMSRDGCRVVTNHRTPPPKQRNTATTTLPSKKPTKTPRKTYYSLKKHEFIDKAVPLCANVEGTFVTLHPKIFDMHSFGFLGVAPIQVTVGNHRKVAGQLIVKMVVS